nr:ras and Rab interactor 1-like [Nothobranchius furzeri]XP_015816811.2 ras and Rab interactor 1-like [Nothobranchius furzeri]
MSQQEEPLYDFPEPIQPSQRKLLCQRGRGSLRSISVLDRLLLTVPVWLQLSINPATALHILQREPPGTFLVRKSRTSKRNVLCVRLADDSVPSFVQQFGIREEQSTLSLETSAISFPDLPRLLSFYCVSRDVLTSPLELPEAIAKASSHKELESISHMGVEFWSSHLNVRGPRVVPKPRIEEKKPDAAASAPPDTPLESAPHPDSESQPTEVPESNSISKETGPRPTLFHEFCPIRTRSPRELDCGSGQGALCFINPLFLQTQTSLSRRRMFKHSLKVRVSTETSTLLSPPLAPPPPPPLIAKTKRKCKGPKQGPCGVKADQTADDSQPPTQTQETQSAPPASLETQLESQEEMQRSQIKDDTSSQLPVITEPVLDEYMTPQPINSHSLSPYQSPVVSPRAAPLFPKVYPSHSPHESPSASPSLSPYQSPSLSPRIPAYLSPNYSPSISPSPSPSSSPLTEQVCCAQTTPPGAEEETHTDGDEDHIGDLSEEESVDFLRSASSLEEIQTCSSNSDVESEAPPLLPDKQASDEQTEFHHV